MKNVELIIPDKDHKFDEAMKTLRTNIQFSGAGIRKIMITSTEPDEGKSMIAFNVALSFADAGKKVLLVDTDIRKSVLVTRYQLDREVHGLSQYLSGQKSIDEITYATNIEGLDIIFSGPYSPNPSELLEGELLKQLLAWAEGTYDYVIVDTPPLGSVIDGAVVAHHCDGAVIVIESGQVSYKKIQKVKRQIDKSGCRILGAVLNKASTSKGSYYNAYYGEY